MKKKFDIQTNILISNDSQKVGEEELLDVLKLIAPGTLMRLSIDGALKTGKGALIVVENEGTPQLIDGGFRINTKFTPQKLIELTKMDGAIILSRDMKKINYANVLLTPSNKISTKETGTRHKAAERTAKQAMTLVIAISERRKEITLYYKNKKYSIVETEEILRKTNENIQIVEKQRELFDGILEKLNRNELRGSFSLKTAINVIQKGIFIKKIANEIKKNCVELGKEGTLLKIRLKEVLLDVEKETELVIKDYANNNVSKVKSSFNELSIDEISEDNTISNLMGYENVNSPGDFRGWRILSKTSLLEPEIAKVLKENAIEEIIKNKDNVLNRILGDEKAQKIIDEIGNIRSNI